MQEKKHNKFNNQSVRTRTLERERGGMHLTVEPIFVSADPSADATAPINKLGSITISYINNIHLHCKVKMGKINKKKKA